MSSALSRSLSRCTRRPTRHVSITTNISTATASGNQPPSAIFSPLDARNRISTSPNVPNSAHTAAGFQFQR